jgi:O-antigen biosynthesis protein
MKIKVVDLELSRPIETIEGLDGYDALKVLVRLHGAPIGYTSVAVTEGICPANHLSNAVLEQNGQGIIQHLLSDGLPILTDGERMHIRDLIDTQHPCYNGPQPLVTVAVCTRDRVSHLTQCLESLGELKYPALDLLLVDNAPSSDATRLLVFRDYPNIRYVLEPRPGLDWARNRAIHEARGEIIAYADDDTVVDPGWVMAIVRAFSEDPEVMAVTGLVVPYELETEAQILFEDRAGFGRGFERKKYGEVRRDGRRAARHYGNVGKFGTGANMAYRRAVFAQIGGFDPALDIGTISEGGGDLEMFFRVVKSGFKLVYEPNAVVYHRHRRDYAQLRTQLSGWGIGCSSYLMRCFLSYPDERFAIGELLLRSLAWHVIRLGAAFFHYTPFPKDLIIAELAGLLSAFIRYPKSRSIAADIERTCAPPPPRESLHGAEGEGSKTT